VRVTRDAVRRARLAALGLAERGGDAVAAARPGLRDTPAGAHRDALAARLPPSSRRFATQEGAERHVDEGLVAIWGPRAAPYVVPRGDLGVFTRGGLPTDEASAKVYAPSAVKALAPHGISVLDAVAQVGHVMRAAVADGPVERDAMHQRLREALPPALLWPCKGCGTDHVHPMVWRAACAYGAIGRDDTASSRAVTYAPIADPPATAQDAAARAELLRRVLHHHGPLTTRELQAHLALARAEVVARLAAIAGEVEEVDREGKAAHALVADLDALADPPAVEGVRFVAAADPLLEGRDRGTLVQDAAAHKALWTVIASPGAVVADGRIAGTWRARAKGRRLEVAVTALPGARLPALRRLEPEAEALAAGRGLAGATVSLAGP
jgi:hypothetical protein